MDRRARRLAAACALALAVTLAVQCPSRRPDDRSRWDEARLLRELAPLGYEHAAVPDVFGAPGARVLFLARPGHLPWEDLARRLRSRGERPAWRGVVVVTREPSGRREGHFADTLAAPPWFFFGDPAELDRVTAGLGLPR